MDEVRCPRGADGVGAAPVDVVLLLLRLLLKILLLLHVFPQLLSEADARLCVSLALGFGEVVLRAPASSPAPSCSPTNSCWVPGLQLLQHSSIVLF